MRRHTGKPRLEPPAHKATSASCHDVVAPHSCFTQDRSLSLSLPLSHCLGNTIRVHGKFGYTGFANRGVRALCLLPSLSNYDLPLAPIIMIVMLHLGMVVVGTMVAMHHYYLQKP